MADPPNSPAVEATTITRPRPAATISGAASRISSNGAWRLIAIEACPTAEFCPHTGRSSLEPTPALLTRISTGPSRRRVSPTAARQPCAVLSDTANVEIAGCDAASSSSSAVVRDTPITRAPASASATAVARPMPRPAPVTSATCPSSSRSLIPGLRRELDHGSELQFVGEDQPRAVVALELLERDPARHHRIRVPDHTRQTARAHRRVEIAGVGGGDERPAPELDAQRL